MSKSHVVNNSVMVERSTKKMIFYSLGIIVGGFLYSMFNQLQFFAVSLLLIPQTTIALMFLIYSIVDGINDPILGYWTDRSTRFTEKHGKRFPYIVIGTFISPILLIFCFMPFGMESIALIAVILTILMCIYETMRTLAEININALFPDMFRGERERRKVSSIGVIISFFNSLLGIILIPLFISIYGGATSKTAFFMATITIVIIVYIIAIPFSFGVKEPDDLKQLRIRLDTEKKSSSPIKEVVTRIFKDRVWMSFTLAYFFYTIAGYCLLAGINFYVIHGLGQPISAVILPQLGTLVMSVVAIPIFSKISHKYGAKLGYILSFVILAIFFILFFLFVNEMVGFTILFLLLGIGLGGNGFMYNIVSSEAIDNAVVKSGKREEATYNGILRIFSAFCYFFQALIFALVSEYSGYDPALGAAQTELAKLGLKIQMSLIPFFLIIAGLIIFTLGYPLSRHDAIENRKKLIELNL
ncbi:MAG: MFS transporter [Promethearchaeota archaeon]